MLKRRRSKVVERKVKEGKGLDLDGMCTEMEFWSFGWFLYIFGLFSIVFRNTETKYILYTLMNRSFLLIRIDLTF